MNLIEQVAKSIFIRRGQYEIPPVNSDPNSFHIYVPGSLWSMKHDEWNNLSDKTEWLSEAEIWLSTLREKSPLTYSYLTSYVKDDIITTENLELL